MLGIPDNLGNTDAAWFAIQRRIFDLGNVPFNGVMDGLYAGKSWQLAPRLYCKIGDPLLYEEKEFVKSSTDDKIKKIQARFADDPYEIEHVNPHNNKYMACSLALRSYMYRGSEQDNVITNRSDDVCIKPNKVEAKLLNLNNLVSFNVRDKDKIEVACGMRWSADITLKSNYSSKTMTIECPNKSVYITKQKDIDDAKLHGYRTWLTVDDLLLFVNEKGIVLVILRLTIDEYRKLRKLRHNENNYTGFTVLKGSVKSWE